MGKQTLRPYTPRSLGFSMAQSLTKRARTGERKSWRILGQNCLHHVAGDIREPVVAPGVAIRELLVIDAEQMKNRRVQIVHVNLVGQRRAAVVVSGAVNVAAFRA